MIDDNRKRLSKDCNCVDLACQSDHCGALGTGVYILQMTRILFPGRTEPVPKIFAIEGNPTPPN